MAQTTDNEEVASPAAAVMARRATREATPAKRKVAARYDKDDDEWTPSSEEDDTSDEDGEAGEEEAGEVRGRVRLHAVKKRARLERSGPGSKCWGHSLAVDRSHASPHGTPRAWAGRGTA